MTRDVPDRLLGQRDRTTSIHRRQSAEMDLDHFRSRHSDHPEPEQCWRSECRGLRRGPRTSSAVGGLGPSETIADPQRRQLAGGLVRHQGQHGARRRTGASSPTSRAFYDAHPNHRTSPVTATFGGTSGATPMVAGHLGLLLEMWTDGAFGNVLRQPGRQPVRESALTSRPPKRC